MQLQKTNHLESQNRGYPKTLVGNQLKRVTETRQISDQTDKKGNGVPLVLTYQPRLKNVNDIIKKHLVYLYAKKQVENIFTPLPFVSFREGFSLRKHLVRAKVYLLLHECGSSGCNKSRCQTCLNVKNTDAFQSFVTKKSYKINHKSDCDSKCIFYCSLVKHVGYNMQALLLRNSGLDGIIIKNCQREAAPEDTPPQSLFHQHFPSEGPHRLVNDCEITLIDKTDSSNPTRLDFFLIRLLKTYYPLDLNTEEELYSVIVYFLEQE